MSSKFDSYQKRRLQSSYISVVISIALVLFLVGILGLVLLKSTFVANRVKEKVAISLFLKDGVSYKQITTFQESLEKEVFTKKVIYTSKKLAARNFSKEIGEDFLEFLGKNPLKNGLDIYLKAIKGELFTWRENIHGRLAEIIILDQFSRHIYRIY